MPWLEIEVAGGSITIEPRPPHCNRGRVVAKVHVTDPRLLFVSGEDSWPRYYFDAMTAVIECQEWLAAHGALECHNERQPAWWLYDHVMGERVGRNVDPIVDGAIHQARVIDWLMEGPKVR